MVITGSSIAVKNPAKTAFERMSRPDAAENSSKRADLARLLVLQMINEAGSGHIGSSLSCLDIMSVLRFEQMNWSADRDRSNTDVFILSKGHAVPAWYATLMVSGELPMRLVHSLRQIDSPLQGHPDRVHNPLMDASTGALGQGLSMAIGRSFAKRLKGQESYVYCLLGDGECQEGQVWEAAMLAGARRVGNLIAFVDHNQGQNDGSTSEVMGTGPIATKMAAFGWHVQTIDGHSHDNIRTAVEAAKRETGRPSIIIANTRKGYLSPTTSALNGAHSGSLTPSEYDEFTALLSEAL